MADDDRDGPARPGPRGPRVVTGGSAPAGDDTSETVPWTPIQRPSPPAGGLGGRRPAVPSRPPDAEPDDADTDDAPWAPPAAGRVVPPPLHRSSAPAPRSYVPPPPTRAAKPGKPPKAAKPGRPGGSGKARTPLRVLLAVVLLAVLAVAGLLIANAVRPDGVDYAKLEPGDCIDTPEGTEVRRITVRQCDESHDAEVFAVVTHPAAEGDAFPGAPALLEYAANACLGQPFTDYIGIPRAQSQLTEFEIVPESEAWGEGRRGLVCAVDNADRSPLTASVRGSGR